MEMKNYTIQRRSFEEKAFKIRFKNQKKNGLTFSQKIIVGTLLGLFAIPFIYLTIAIITQS